jgi:hypothetical protein
MPQLDKLKHRILEMLAKAFIALARQLESQA